MSTTYNLELPAQRIKELLTSFDSKQSQILSVAGLGLESGAATYSVQNTTYTGSTEYGAGALGFRWTNASLYTEGTKYYAWYSLCDETEDHNPIEPYSSGLFAINDEISSKAGMSWNFLGKVIANPSSDTSRLYIQLTQRTPTGLGNYNPATHRVTDSAIGYLWCPKKPKIGFYKIGYFAVALGATNQANERNAIAIGDGNLVDGRNAVAIGMDNKVAYGSLAVGESNTVKGIYNTVFGYNNDVGEIFNARIFGEGNHTYANVKADGTVPSEYTGAFINGINNALGAQGKATFINGVDIVVDTTTAPGVFVNGYGHRISKLGPGAIVCGQYAITGNSFFNDAIFVAGFGTGPSTAYRKNVATMDSTGSFTLASELYTCSTSVDCRPNNGFRVPKIYTITSTTDTNKPNIKKGDFGFVGSTPYIFTGSTWKEV